LIGLSIKLQELSELHELRTYIFQFG